jgi:hypothetical protein
MATIEILEQVDAEEGKTTLREAIKIEGIEPSRIAPVNMKVGSLIPMTELLNLIAEIKPIEQPQSEELDDSYYAQGVSVYEDGDLSSKTLDLPHHIGLRVVLESVLQKYGTSDNLQIEIS